MFHFSQRPKVLSLPQASGDDVRPPHDQWSGKENHPPRLLPLEGNSRQGRQSIPQPNPRLATGAGAALDKPALGCRAEDSRVLVGGVSKTRAWIRAQLPFPVINVVIGVLTCPMKTSSQGEPNAVRERFCRSFILEDSKEPRKKIRCLFYNIDRTLPTYPAGHWLKVSGKPRKDGSLLVFSYGPVEPPQSLNRLEFFSERGIKLGCA